MIGNYESRQIIDFISSLGYKAYYAGGCVRDNFLDREPNDLDIVTDCPLHLLKNKFKTVDIGGEKFGILVVLINNEKFEVANFRKDSEYSDGRRPLNVSIGTEEEDSKRRDFTINGIFYDPINKKLIDYVGGLIDIRKELIRCIGNPDDRFQEDYLRMLRAIRFACQLNMDIEGNTWESLKIHSGNITKISSERIRVELLNILRSQNPYMGINFLNYSGLLKHILPEVSDMIRCTQPKRYHPEGDVFDHTIKMLSLISNVKEVEHDLFPLAVLLHDVGKPKCRKEDSNGIITFYNHDSVGSEIVQDIAKRLTLPNKATDYLVFMTKNHMKIKNFWDMSLGKKMQLASSEYFLDLVELNRLDCLSSSRNENIEKFYEFYNENYEKIHYKDFISGNELIKLGMKPGPLFGEIIRTIRHKYYNNEILNKEEAISWVIKKYKLNKSSIEGKYVKFINNTYDIDYGKCVKENKDNYIVSCISSEYDDYALENVYIDKSKLIEVFEDKANLLADISGNIVTLNEHMKRFLYKENTTG